MKTVWVICEEVDLGYHMVKGFSSYDRAEAECSRMNEHENREVLARFVQGGYDQEYAENWVKHYESNKYQVQSVEVEE